MKNVRTKQYRTTAADRAVRIFTALSLTLGLTLSVCIPVHAYIDPSIMTYTVQAVAGLMIASATFIGIGWRRLRRRILSDSVIASKRYSSFESDELQFDDTAEGTCVTPQTVDVTTSAVWQKIQNITDRKEKDSGTRTAQVMTWKQRLLMVGIPSLFLTVTAFLYLPSSLYLANINEFLVSYGKVFPLMLGVTAFFFILLVLFGLMLNDFSCRLVSALILAAGLGVYLQGNFLNPPLPTFNGQAIQWDAYAVSTQRSTAAWIAVFIIVPLLALFVRKYFDKISRALCLLLTAMQVVSLCFTAAQTGGPDNGDFYFMRNREFELSRTKNTVVFVVDTFDGQWFDDLFLHNDAYNYKLKDFTFFINAIAGAAPTSMGLPYMFTGVEYKLGLSNTEYQEYAYTNGTLFSDLKNAGVSTRIYTEHNDYFWAVDPDLIENTSPNTLEYSVSDPFQYIKKLYRIAAYIESPMKFKKYFAMWENPLMAYTSVSGGNGPQYKIDDPQFYIDFQNEHLNPTYDNTVFTVYHLFGAHNPYYMDENAKRIPTATNVQDHINQMFGVYKIITEIIQQMKDIGIYDSSTIIITGDHGGLNYYQNPAILVKRPYVTQDKIYVNNAPVTFDNLYAEYAASLLPDASSYGQTLFDVPEDLVIERKHAVNCGNVLRATFPEVELFRRKDIMEITFYGDARDIDNVYYSEETSYKKPKK